MHRCQAPNCQMLEFVNAQFVLISQVPTAQICTCTTNCQMLKVANAQLPNAPSAKCSNAEMHKQQMLAKAQLLEMRKYANTSSHILHNTPTQKHGHTYRWLPSVVSTERRSLRAEVEHLWPPGVQSHRKQHRASTGHNWASALETVSSF